MDISFCTLMSGKKKNAACFDIGNLTHQNKLNIMKFNKDLQGAFTKIGPDGYLVVPRALLDEALKMETRFSVAQAYLYLFVHCAFCDQPKDGGLKRGQMAFTAAELAERFNWSTRIVRDFLYSLRERGIVELEQVPGVQSKLTMCFYEALTGGRGRPIDTDERKDCHAFWRRYYELLNRDATDYYATVVEWGRMTRVERALAMQNMERYFRSLNDIQYVRSAANYLKYKAYLMPENVDEYLNL